MPINPLYLDFFSFLYHLAPGADTWALYREHYFDKHEVFLTAWWDQCMGQPREVLQARVAAVEREHYTGLRALLETGDIEAATQDALDRCMNILPAPAPTVNLMFGFFSPDGFVIEVAGEWQIGLGLERLGDIERLPLLVAHEYAHWYRRSRGLSDTATLGGRLIEEGLAAHLSALAYPKRPLCDHLFVTPARLAALQDYKGSLLAAAQENLDCKEPAAIARFLYAAAAPDAPPRPGGFVGHQMISYFLTIRRLPPEALFAAPAASLLEILAANN